jgi:mRNA-degrading endonuclease RelE of RelBE toxin-antitoxin system
MHRAPVSGSAFNVAGHATPFASRPLLPRVHDLIEAKIHDVGSRLNGYSHHRLKGRTEYRLRAGDYRVIYEFDQQKNVLYLLTLGHRRDIYR